MSEQGTCPRGDLCSFAHNIRELRATVQSSQKSSFGGQNNSFGGQNNSFGGQNNTFDGQNNGFGNRFGGSAGSGPGSSLGSAFGGLKRKQEFGSYQQTVKNSNFCFFYFLVGFHLQGANLKYSGDPKTGRVRFLNG